MAAMPFVEHPLQKRPILWAIAASLAIHGLALIIPHHNPSGERVASPRLEARLAPRPQPVLEEAPVQTELPAQKIAKSPQRPAVLSTNKPGGRNVTAQPKWSAAEKEEMNRFLDELAVEAKTRPKPTLAQRALSMAREDARQQARDQEAGLATLEMRAEAAPPDPFSLSMYVDSLIKKLNRSSSFVRNDPRNKGVRPAAVQFRLNPDGTLKSFVVLNAADQADEIAFIKSVVERSAPFSPFPPDINKAARSLAMTICIFPSSDGGMGFTKMNGRGC